MRFNCDTYARFIEQNYESIAKRVNKNFDASKDFIKARILKEIRKYIMPLPIHYEWDYDGCPYDMSGILVQDGHVSLDQTIRQFLDEEYTGRKRATFERGHGWSYDTYSDELMYLTLEIGCSVMRATIEQCLKEQFGEAFTEEEMTDIMDGPGDLVYDNSLTADFFWWEAVIDYLGIGEMKLCELVKGRKLVSPL